uniref:MSP domain-containing protein n=1 Tax=Heterorhabditis bacteriophora TaxID=37862 RepID=A0A1I7W619_HETBA
MRFRNHCHHPLLYASSTMSHLLVFFKHSNTFTVIPSENISGDLNTNSIVVVPYGARRKYRAVIKFIESKASCEAVSEKIFSQPPKTSTPLSKGSPAKKTPTVMPIQSASCSSCVFSSYYFKKLRRNLIFNYQSFHTIGYLNKLLMISIWTQKAQRWLRKAVNERYPTPSTAEEISRWRVIRRGINSYWYTKRKTQEEAAQKQRTPASPQSPRASRTSHLKRRRLSSNESEEVGNVYNFTD